MYSPPGAVIAELARRRRDKGLVKGIADYLDGPPPEGWPEDRPIATLNRYVASAHFEDIVFAHMARSIVLRPYWPTYLAERFTLKNPEKVSYLRPRVHREKLHITKKWLIADHEARIGKELGSIQVNGADLATVHAEARARVFDADLSTNQFDVSAWNKRQALRFGANDFSQRLAPHYYRAVMALYICHGVLFEDFDGGPNATAGLDGFVRQVVRPAFDSVAKTFGLKPLIVRLPYIEGFLDFPQATAAVFDKHYEKR